MHCNEEDKQSIKENHRQRYRTLLNATTSTLHTSIVPYRTTIQDNRHKKANEIHPLHFIDRGGGVKKNHLEDNHTPPLFYTRADFSKVILYPQKRPLQMKERAAPIK